eukprot:jgi/Picsp_1/4316/NSC_01824-R1_domain protein
MRHITIAIDESEMTHVVCKWVHDVFLRANDKVDIIAVKYMIPAGMAPVPPLISSGTIGAVSDNYTQAVKEEEARVDMLLRSVVQQNFNGVENVIRVHALDPTGGASSVGHSIVSWCKQHASDILFLGSRGMGTARGMLMSIVGLGSVSSYCLHNMESPVCVIHGSANDDQVCNKEKVLVCVDDSSKSKIALEWAIRKFVSKENELHIVSVALPVPYDIEEQDVASVSALSPSNDSVLSAQSAGEQVEAASKRAIEMGIDKNQIISKTLKPGGGASEIAKSIEEYVVENGIGSVVLGTRGMSAVKRTIMSLVGLGSVSDWCVHNLKVSVFVVMEAHAGH